MNKAAPVESIAAALAVLGAVCLAFVYFPILNPAQYGVDNHGHPASMLRYVVGTPVSLLVLLCAWHFNRKSRKLKAEHGSEDKRLAGWPHEDILKMLFVMSTLCATLSVLALVAVSAIAFVPTPATQGFRAQLMGLGALFAATWSLIAVWARTRRHAKKQTFLSKAIAQSFLFVSVIFCLGIVIYFLG